MIQKKSYHEIERPSSVYLDATPRVSFPGAFYAGAVVVIPGFGDGDRRPWAPGSAVRGRLRIQRLSSERAVYPDRLCLTIRSRR